MWIKGRVWKWCEKRVFVSFSREELSLVWTHFKLCQCLSSDLISASPSSFRHWECSKLHDSSKPRGCPRPCDTSAALIQIPVPGAVADTGKPQLLLAALSPVLDVGTWAQWGFLRASWQKKSNCWNASVYICNSITLEQFHFLWTSLKVCFCLLLPWIIHSLRMRVIGVWLSQAGLLCPLSSNCFGMLQASVIFPAFVLSIHCSWC